MTVLSSTYFYPFDYLGKADLIKEVIKESHFYYKFKNVDEIKSVTRESLYLSKSNLILGYPKTMDPKDPFLSSIKNREGVIPILDYLEKTPLARAEWGVAIAYLIGAGNKFETHFQKIAKNYQKIKSYYKNKQPLKILNAQTYLGEWFVTSKDGHISKLLSDVKITNSIKQVKSRQKISREKLLGNKSKFWLVLGMENSRKQLEKL